MLGVGNSQKATFTLFLIFQMSKFTLMQAKIRIGGSVSLDSSLVLCTGSAAFTSCDCDGLLSRTGCPRLLTLFKFFFVLH